MSSVMRGSIINGGRAGLSARWFGRAMLAEAAWLPRWCQGRGLFFWVAANLAVTFAYAGLGWAVGHFFARFGLFPAPIWLPAGLAATAAMLGGMRLCAGVFLGSLLVNGLVFGAALPEAAAISAGNALGPLAGALLSRRLRPATGLFTRFQGVIAFVVGIVLLHALVTATVGTLSLLWLGGLPWTAAGATWASWLLCDAGGTFYFAPSLALWLGIERTPAVPGATPARHRLMLDGAVWLATAGLAVLVFSVELPGRLPSAQLVFLLAVPLSWIALRISLRAAYTLLTLICVIASAGTVAGLGPFQGAGVANPMQSASMLVVLCATNILTLLALVSERREAEWALALANRTLEVRVAERTAQLRHQAETDALTGIANRRGFVERAERSLAAARGFAVPFGLITFDIDHFKAINDAHGHAGGDAVLRLVASRCQAQLRGDDLFGRMGGEEFAIALPGQDCAAATVVAERLRHALREVRPGFALPGGHLAASFGIAVRQPGEGLSQLLLRADGALYEAKHQGRDQVRLAALSPLPGRAAAG
ncbi:sensor domain-containing diguanylate cyclase [Roseomonas haemaphysalidis]|uniref:diguanylate cyclase n=1 Tax=Roseomonas haemaphysalidis TaxID=2768162 RepID=A0ABS3KTI8_9PROT|nr:diguanylate cyclase [Roseomonas haemaphysalidis]MBO1080783.1 sensor domain-containing diguanylate cyclase [Roseomonas haemaphysalidis]